MKLIFLVLITYIFKLQIIFAKKIWSLRLGVRTPGFHPGNRGSIPLGTATFKTHLMMGFFNTWYNLQYLNGSLHLSHDPLCKISVHLKHLLSILYSRMCRCL